MINEIREKLKMVIDPEMHHDIVSLGLVYKIHFDTDEKKANILMTLTSPTCPYAGVIICMVKQGVEAIEAVKECEVKITFEPYWNPEEMISDDIKLEMGIF